MSARRLAQLAVAVLTVIVAVVLLNSPEAEYYAEWVLFAELILVDVVLLTMKRGEMRP